MSANPKCPSCGKPVYHAEKALAAGREWHKECLRCTKCGKGLLGGTNLSKNDGKLYCTRPCYQATFNQSGFGFGGVTAIGKESHGDTATSSISGQPAASVESSRAKFSGGGDASSQQQSQQSAPAASSSSGAVSARSFGGGAKCPACGKTVYSAEKVLAAGGEWHKDCLKCSKCNRIMVGSHNMSERDGKVYCTKPCYQALFNESGFGYGGATTIGKGTY